jgi:choline dehydrogenase-like flavoprotein
VTDHLRTEVLVIGSGAGGAETAAMLAEAGLDVLVAEEGPAIAPGSLGAFTLPEMVHAYRDRGVNATVGAPPIAYVEGRCVGGGTEVNSGLYHRPPPELVAQWADEYRIVDLDPVELAVHSKEIEDALGVSPVPGRAPAASDVLERGARRLGWDVSEVPRVFRYPAGTASWRDGVKQTMTRTFLPRAVAAGASVVADCRIRRLVIAGGRARAAVGVWRRDPESPRTDVRIDADHIFLCAGAIQTPALLQRSGRWRSIGGGLKLHPTIKLAARFSQPFDDHAVPMHQVKEFAPDVTLGGSASRPGHVALALVDNWAANADAVSEADRVAVYYSAIRSEGSGRVVNPPMLPSPVVQYRLTEADMSRLARGAVALGQLLFEAGAERLYPTIAGAPAITTPRQLVDLWSAVDRRRVSLMTIHLFSSVRMGERRGLTGTDSFGRVWGVDNLRVNDASLIPDAPGVNPQGTIMAIAARNCARFLAQRR